jgi:hypothetical protein
MNQYRVGERNPTSRTKRHNSEPVGGEMEKRLRIEDTFRNEVRREKYQHSDGVLPTTMEPSNLTDEPRDNRDLAKAIIISAKRNVNRSDTMKDGISNAQSINPDPAADNDGRRTIIAG